MTCLDADLAENGVCLMGAAAAHSVLELGEKLERVQGNDAVVMISRKKQHGRGYWTPFDGALHCAVENTRGDSRTIQHRLRTYKPHQAYPMVNLWKRSISITPTLGNNCAEKIWPLIAASTDQEPAVGASHDAEFLFCRVVLAYEIFAAVDEIIKHISGFSLVPALCHSSPYSPPPRRFAMQKIPSISSMNGSLNGEK